MLLASAGPDNPYQEHELADLGTGLYCETVMAERRQLIVVDARSSEVWCDCPDAKLNMISYLGLPLIWPDDTIFGTVCILDSVAHAYSEEIQDLLLDLKHAIEDDFRVICGVAADDRSAQRFLSAAHGGIS